MVFRKMVEIWMCGFQGTKVPERIPVVMAKGSHLFPYRTQKLSLSAPMVLGWRRPGRVGHCRIPNETPQQKLGCFSFGIHPSYSVPFRLQLSATLYLARIPYGGAQWAQYSHTGSPGSEVHVMCIIFALRCAYSPGLQASTQVLG